MLSLETCQKLKEADFVPVGEAFKLFGRLAYYRRGSETIYIACNEAWDDDDLLCYDYPLEELLEAIREMADSIRNGDDNDLDICWYLELHDEGDRYSVHQVPISDKWTGITIEHTDPSEAAAALWLKLKGVQ